MAAKPLPDQSVLLKLLRYEPDTGKIYWKSRPIEFAKASGQVSALHRQSVTNSRIAGKEAFTCVNATGYFSGAILGQACLAHRVIWKMMTGEDAAEIDHINGDRKDNRFCNLRSVTRRENTQNRSRSIRNRSGTVGVRQRSQSGKWIAQIKVRSKSIYLGEFEDINDAIDARKKAERTYGFHPNHGRQRAKID